MRMGYPPRTSATRSTTATSTYPRVRSRSATANIALHYTAVPQVANFNGLPLKVINGVPIFLGEVAPATDTHMVQTNIVRIDGKRATYLPIYKHAAAST